MTQRVGPNASAVPPRAPPSGWTTLEVNALAVDIRARATRDRRPLADATRFTSDVSAGERAQASAKKEVRAIRSEVASLRGFPGSMTTCTTPFGSAATGVTVRSVADSLGAGWRAVR